MRIRFGFIVALIAAVVLTVASEAMADPGNGLGPPGGNNGDATASSTSQAVAVANSTSGANVNVNVSNGFGDEGQGGSLVAQNFKAADLSETVGTPANVYLSGFCNNGSAVGFGGGSVSVGSAVRFCQLLALAKAYDDMGQPEVAFEILDVAYITLDNATWFESAELPYPRIGETEDGFNPGIGYFRPAKIKSIPILGWIFRLL